MAVSRVRLAGVWIIAGFAAFILWTVTARCASSQQSTFELEVIDSELSLGVSVEAGEDVQLMSQDESWVLTLPPGQLKITRSGIYRTNNGCLGFVSGEAFITVGHCVSKQPIGSGDLDVNQSIKVTCTCFEDNCNDRNAPDLALCTAADGSTLPASSRRISTGTPPSDLWLVMVRGRNTSLVRAGSASCAAARPDQGTALAQQLVEKSDSGGPTLGSGDQAFGVVEQWCGRDSNGSPNRYKANFVRFGDRDVKNWMCEWASDNVKIPGLNRCPL